jgi:hypothetical protein
MIGVTPMEEQEFATNGAGAEKKLTGGLKR